MNIFGVGGWELILIILIALIVAGPKRMAHWAYIVGGYVGQLRGAWRGMMETVQKEFDDAGVDIKVPKDIPNRSDITRFAGQIAEPLTKPMREAMDEVNQDVNEVKEVASMRTPQRPNSVEDANGRANGNSQNPYGTWSINNQENKTNSSTTDSPSKGFGTWSADSNSDDKIEGTDD